MLLQEFKGPIAEVKAQILEVWGRLDPDQIRKLITEKEELSSTEGFWNDQKKAEKTMSDLRSLRNRIDPWEELLEKVQDLEALFELTEEASDDSMIPELEQSLDAVNRDFKKLSILNMMSDEVDRNSAFLTIHAGAGGTEACDWAQMLARMYVRWAERRGYKVDTVDMLEADGGIKSITYQISGEYVFGYLKGEAGVHRLVRISPFDSAARRHTSFTSVYAFPVLDDTIEVDVRPEDLRVDTYRAGGAGGQHVNKTDSAVRFTHLPTGIVVACQTERSQLMNRQTAMSILKARLYEYYREEKEKENMKFATEKKDISWGNQIRSYVFQPYTMVKDHRTKHESGNIQAVMDGDLDPFMETWLNMKWKGKPLEGEEDDL
ncbi:MAG TPA: peptide chain release factor 2 [Treponemataceae bacterium]|nr:peptide chain release factor 2 [Treponemataceae bacterium]HOS34909.1 peptide chain release factor 2 [Treponemataceae bacterium]HOU38709.1 peptide chain release factor 2 [Treponemataceae bacterium]HPL91143.1 peptide chain release factor 2 [Treponemataceae bacterium]HPX12907.1 peptide chain release factor 2 [Treponemataceae bacterium]